MHAYPFFLTTLCSACRNTISILAYTVETEVESRNENYRYEEERDKVTIKGEASMLSGSFGTSCRLSVLFTIIYARTLVISTSFHSPYRGDHAGNALRDEDWTRSMIDTVLNTAASSCAFQLGTNTRPPCIRQDRPISTAVA